MHNSLSSRLHSVFWPFLLSRSIILGVFVAVRNTIFIQEPASVINFLNPEIRLTLRSIIESLRTVIMQGDINWYLTIAGSGYAPPPFNPTLQQNWVFFPLWAGVLWVLNLITGHAVICGFIFANLLFLLALIFLVELCERKQIDTASTSRAIWLLCFFPTSYFFSLPMTESLFMALTTGSFLLLAKKESVRSSLLFSLATATRPTGLLLLPSYWLGLIREKELNSQSQIAAAAIAPLGLLLFILYQAVQLGDPLAFIKGQAAWERGQTGILGLFQQLYSDPLLAMKPWNFLWLNLICAVLSLIASIYWLRRREFEYATYCFIPIACSLLTGSLLSISRFTLLLFPVFMMLGLWSKTRERELTVIVFCVVLLVVLCVLFARGGMLRLLSGDILFGDEFFGDIFFVRSFR